MLANLKIHYHFQGKRVRSCMSCCIYLSQLTILSLSYVFILSKKCESSQFLTVSSAWTVGWNGCFVDIAYFLVFLNSRPFDLLSYLIFELLNSSFVWPLHLRGQIKEEFKSSKIRYDKRSKGREFKKRVQNHILVERRSNWQKRESLILRMDLLFIFFYRREQK